MTLVSKELNLALKWISELLDIIHPHVLVHCVLVHGILLILKLKLRWHPLCPNLLLGHLIDHPYIAIRSVEGLALAS